MRFGDTRCGGASARSGLLPRPWAAWLGAAVGSLATLAGCTDSSGAGGSGGTGGHGGTGGAGGAGADRHVVVLFTSDEHSHLFSFSPELDDYPTATAPGQGKLVGGVARRASVLAKERKAAADAGKDSILVSSGDNQMGCLPHLAFESDSIDYGTMKTLGYDVTTFGNHEFDFGPKALANSIHAAQAGAGLPAIVASNVHFSDTDSADDELAALYSTTVTDDKPVHPYRVVTTASGLKIGVFGYVGINAAHVAPNKTPVAFSAPVDSKKDGDIAANLPALFGDLQPIVDKLRNEEKVDLVVALSHAGIQDGSTEASTLAGEDPQVCLNVSGIDLIVSGHAHSHDPKPIKVANASTQKPCLVLNAGAFGKEVGRVDFTVPRDLQKGVTWDTATQALVPVDDTTLPEPMLASKLDGYVKGIEATGTGGSTLGKLLSHAQGMSLVDDPNTIGDLYFHKLGATDFDITDTHALNWLSADAMLAEADALKASGSLPATDMGVESAGVIRSVLLKGKTGTISAADAFNVVPLGRSPVDGSIGNPLVRAKVSLFELRAVVEFALAQGATNSDYDLGLAGLKVEFDKSRPPVLGKADLFDDTKGQVMRLLLDTNHADGYEQFDSVIYDRVMMIGDNSILYSLITSSYIAQFAGDAGVTPKDDTGNAATVPNLIVKRTFTGGDGSEVKQVEAFMGFIHQSPGGKLPSTYDKASAAFTKRWVCTQGC